MNSIEVCVGEHDAGRVKHIAEIVRSRGGIVGEVYDVLAQIDQRRPQVVIITGEMLDRCVYVLADELLQEGRELPKNVIIDLRRVRSFGVFGMPDDTDTPDQEELNARYRVITGRLWSHRDNPRLLFIPAPSTFTVYLPGGSQVPRESLGQRWKQGL